MLTYNTRDPSAASVAMVEKCASKPSRGLSLVMLSDTHNCHRQLQVPNADILIHAGDYTRYGKLEDAVDFNTWLGELPHGIKIVINGNHESNSSWKTNVKDVISNATVLIDESVAIKCPNGDIINIHGTNFSWPMPYCRNPSFDMIPSSTHILVTHGPAKGHRDSNVGGCPALLERCRELAINGQLELLVCGHIHNGYGVCHGSEVILENIKFINAAILGQELNEPIVIEL